MMAASAGGRRSSVSSTGAHSTDSTPRLSVDKRHSMDRRLSTDSSIRTPLPNIPGVSSLPGLSVNSPLAAGASMPPPTPPKDRLPPPMTPTRKPVLRQKSPLSSEAFSYERNTPEPVTTSASAMPGAFPNTPSPGPATGLSSAGQSNATAYADPQDRNTIPNGKRNAGKRVSSFRNFLPFKSLRRSYGSTSPETSPKVHQERPSTSMSLRPTTPGADSMASGDTRPSLRHKVSGTFWKRKSSLGMMGGSDKQSEQASTDTTNGDGSTLAASPVSARANGTNGSFVNDEHTLHEGSGEEALGKSSTQERPDTPKHDDQASVSPKQRKSGTFWRRTSSLTLDATVGMEKAGWAFGGARKASLDVNGSAPRQELNNAHTHVESAASSPQDESTTIMEVPIVLRRSHSPPPQLPAFVGGGAGLGDLFKDIY